MQSKNTVDLLQSYIRWCTNDESSISAKQKVQDMILDVVQDRINVLKNKEQKLSTTEKYADTILTKYPSSSQQSKHRYALEEWLTYSHDAWYNANELDIAVQKIRNKK